MSWLSALLMLQTGGLFAQTLDFGDHSLLASASSTANSTLRLGASVDAENAATVNFTATGDDITGMDDENGVTLPANQIQGVAGSMTINITNTRGSSAYLNVWIDWNNNGVLTDAGEQLAVNTAIVNGTSNSNRTVSFTAPAGATVGNVGVRVRLTSVTSPGPDGADGVGEVEDNLLAIILPPTLGVGNLVWTDSNDNGRFDTGEGVSGVLVQLVNTSNTVITSTTTDGAGLYQLTTTTPGTYYARIPAHEFASGKSLFGEFSLVGSGAANGKDDDWDENGMDDVAPATNGIRSPNFTLAVGAEPTTSEIGIDSSWDNGTTGRPADANADLTIDFGFGICLQTNLITNGSFETATSSTLTFPDVFPSGGSAIAKTRSTSSNTDVAHWSFDAGSYINDPTHTTDGSRMIHLNSSGACAGQQFAVGSAISGLTQLTAGQVYTLTFDWAPFDPSAPNTPPAGNNTQVYADFYFTNSGWTNSTFINSFADFYEPKTNDFLTNPRPLSSWAALDWRRCRYKFTVPPAPSGQNYLTLFLTAGGSTGRLLIDNVALTTSCEQATGTIGNLIFNDANGNRAKDATESGIDKVLVQLYRRPTSGLAVWVGSTYSTQGGRYLFSGMQPGNYYVWVDSANFAATTPSWWQGGSIAGPLFNKLSSSSNANPNVNAASASDDDVSEKGVDNATPITNGIFSPDFVLGIGSEPVSSVGGKETGAFNFLDDSVDSHGDLTIDFGFVSTTAAADYGDYSLFPPASSATKTTLRMGAVVTDGETIPTTTADATGDDTTGTDDEDGVTLPSSLMQGASSSLSVNVTNTTGSSAYLNVWIDFNRNGVLTDSGEQVAVNTLIATGASAANRTVSFTVPASASLGAAGVRVRLTTTSSPGSTGASGNGEVEDYIVTLATSLSIGNLIWNDADENGLFDPEESGINNVLVELWTSGADNAIGGAGGNADTKVTSTNTAGGGLYNFSGLPAGYYFVKVPTPPLSRTSIVSDPADNGQDGDNNASQPGGSATAAFSPVIQLVGGMEPGSTGTGNIDNSVDFGFASNIGSPFVCDNRFYILQNAETSPGSGIWDATFYYIGSGQTLVPIFIFTGYKLNGLAAYGGYLYCVDQNGSNLYRINSQGVLVDMGIIAGLPNPGSSAQWSGATALTTGRMILNLWNINQATTVLYTIDLASATLIGGGVNCTYSTGGNMSGNMGDIVWDPLTNRVYGYNTIDTSNIGLFEINLTTGVCTRVAAAVPGAWGSMVIDANGLAYGYGSAGASGNQNTLYVFNRTNGVLNGSITAVGSGPAVSNSDGAACPGSPPSMKIGNLVWNDGNNNGLKDTGENGIDGVGVQLFLGGQNSLTAAPAGTVITAGGGVFTFNHLSPGQYFLNIPTPPASFPLSSAGTDTADNGQDNDDNGIQIAQGQAVRSPLIALTAGSESVNDGDTDFNTDLTIDFGFVACPVITVNPTALLNGSVGTVYSQTVSAAGGSGVYTFAVSSGVLPAWASLDIHSGLISGTPTVSNGSGVSITVRATDATACFGERVYTLKICPVITVNPAIMPAAVLGAAYSQTVSAADGSGVYTFAITVGALPIWATLNTTTGVITGTPNSNTAATFTIRATDANGCAATRSYTLTPVCPSILVVPLALPVATVGSPYSQTLAPSGGTASYSAFTVTAGTLPAGLTLSSNGLLSGTPTVSNGAGVSLTIRATDANGCQGTQTIALKVCSVIGLTPAGLTVPTVGAAYAQSITGTGGAAPYVYALTVGAMPAWAAFNASTGALTGTPNSTASAVFIIRATDANGCTGTRSYSMTPICPPITIAPTVHSAYLSTAYSQTLTATGGLAPYSGWIVTSGTLPSGYTLNSAGLLSGFSAVISATTLTVRATDANGCQGSQTITLTVKGMSLGNQVWQDNNNNGSRDAGEPNVSGAQVVLMNPGSDHVIGGSSADVQVGSTATTTSTGLYGFTNLAAGNYYVRVIPPVGYNRTSGTPATNDDNVNDNNDGAQPGGSGADLYSPIIHLAPGAESITDGDTDPDSNWTVDFGLWAALGVGNLVFLDLNGNGKYDSSEGIENVYVQIFAQGANVTRDEPAGVAFTDNKGRYYIDNLNPGSYFLHLPASQFTTGAPLAGMITMASVIAGDDHAGQDLLNATTPATTGASTSVFVLIPGGEPTGTAESGYEGAVDDSFIDSNHDFTLDLGLRSPSGTGYPLAQRDRNTSFTTTTSTNSVVPATQVTFSTWKTTQPDIDGDLYPQLLEYALDTNPADGRSGAAAFSVVSTSAGNAEAIFTRPASGRVDIRYDLEISTNSHSWSKLAASPQLSIGIDGRQIVRYTTIEKTSEFAGHARGLVRLKISLDADLDGVAEDSATSPVFMFSRETFPVGQRSFSMPLVKSEIYAGHVTSEGTTLTLPVIVTLSGESYIEDLSTGSIYEIDEGSSTSTQMTLTNRPTTPLTRMALRAHHTVGSLLPEDMFTAGASVESGDRVLTFDSAANAFAITHLSSSGWQREGVSATETVMARQSAVLVHAHSREVSVLLVGQVSTKLSLEPMQSTRFIGSSSVVDESAATLGLITANGFRASTRATSATRLRFWKADSDATQTGYDSLFLSLAQWQRQNDANGVNLTDEKLLSPFRGFFLVP